MPVNYYQAHEDLVTLYHWAVANREAPLKEINDAQSRLSTLLEKVRILEQETDTRSLMEKRLAQKRLDMHRAKPCGEIFLGESELGTVLSSDKLISEDSNREELTDVRAPKEEAESCTEKVEE